MSVIIILLLPLIAAALVCIPAKKQWAPGVTIVSNLAVLILVARLANHVMAGQTVIAHFNIGMLKWIAVDGLSALILLLVGFVGTTAAIYSAGYMGHLDLKPGRLRLYYANYNMFIFSMLAIPVMAEPTLVWIVVELTTLCSALLVSFDNTREALEASWKYVLLSLMGAGFALFGFLVLYSAMQAAGGGVYTWTGLIKAAPAMPPILLQTAFLLVLIGLGTKVGLVPMHTWLPDAHSQAPSPVCALLSGVETTAILYAILRFFPIMHAASYSHAGNWAMVLGLISVGVAAFLLLQVHDYKRLFAYSTIEHMGIILIAVGMGSAATYGAMQQMVCHSITKSFCFFAAGAVVLSVETRTIDSVRALIKKSPVAGAALIFGGLAIAGAPPLAVFLSEFLIIKAGLTQGHYIVTGLLTLFITIAFFGILFHLNRMTFSSPKNISGQDHAGPHKKHLPFACRLALFLAAIPVFVLGFYIPEPLHHLLSIAAGVLMK